MTTVQYANHFPPYFIPLSLSLTSTKFFSASNGGNRTLHHARLRGSNDVTGEIVEVALWWVSLQINWKVGCEIVN